MAPRDLRDFVGEVIRESSRARDHQYVRGKGLRLSRLGGIGGQRQKGNTASPTGVRSGYWAFIWPHWDWWFLSGDFSNEKFTGKTEKSVDKQGYEYDKRIPVPGQLRRDIWYDGPIFVRFDLRPKHPVWDDSWTLIHTSDVPEILRDFKGRARAERLEMWKDWGGPSTKIGADAMLYANRFRNSDADPYEVFVPTSALSTLRKYLE